MIPALFKELNSGDVVKGLKDGKMYYIKKYGNDYEFVNSRHERFDRQTINPEHFIKENDIQWEKVKDVKVIEGYNIDGTFVERNKNHIPIVLEELQTWMDMFEDHTKLRITIEEIDEYQDEEQEYDFEDVRFSSHEKWGFPAIREHAENLVQQLELKGYDIELRVTFGVTGQPYFHFYCANGDNGEVATINIPPYLDGYTIGSYDVWIDKLDAVARKIENTWKA